MNQKLTLAYLRTSVLELCYDDARLQTLLDRASTEGVLPVLLSLPPSDARRVVAGLLPRTELVEWAAWSARRAKEYAAYAYADAAYAYADAAYAYADAEHALAIRDAVRRLGWGA